jgi:high-affinity iron transporter
MTPVSGSASRGVNVAAAVCAALVLTFGHAPRARAADASPRAVVHLLDYIAQDYGGAVAGGRVINAEEFAEMQEFSNEALRAASEVPQLAADREIDAQLRLLGQLVDQRAGIAAVASQAARIKAAIIERTHLAVAPSRWPNLDDGRALYQRACAACHGAAGHGDGPVAATITPPPADFHDAARMLTLAPFHAFNTIRLGVPGTAMPAFGSLSEDDTWALAFYIVSLRYRPPAVPVAAPVAAPAIPLDVAASESDEQLEKRLTAPGALAAVRLYSSGHQAGDTLATAEALLDDADAAYRAARYGDARKSALAAYLDGVEPVEARVRALSPGTVAELERRTANVRRVIEQRRPAPEVSAAIAAARETVGQARTLLQAPPSSPWFVFSMAALIVLREAFEAVLIIVAILSALRGLGANHAARWVHAGWMAALIAGAVTWLAAESLLAASGVNRELLEAVTSLVAVAVLLYMGFWLHRRTGIAKWKAFIEQQVTSSLSSEKLAGLSVIAFFAVFREAIETVLFLFALSVDGGPDSRRFMAFGVLASLVCTILLAWALVRFSARLPLRTMFAVTAGVMMALSVVLAGKGLHALQEIGASTVTALPVPFRLDLLGLYPTIETILAQTLIAGLSVILWMRARPRPVEKM